MRFLLLSSITLYGADEMGSLLFHGNCTTCHFETQEVSAPAMSEVKKRYKSAFPEKKEFIKQLTTWVHKPSTTNSIMQDAIQKHGLMPELAYDKTVLNDIAAYIYDTNFTKSRSVTYKNFH